MHACLLMAELHHRMRRETRTQGRGHVVPGPVDYFDQGLPERLVGKIGVRDVRASDDQRVESRATQGVKRLVKLRDMRTRRVAARQRRQGKRVHIKLRDRIRLADQPQKLSLGSFQRCVRHHV